jgi:hypothetical protein
LILIPRPPAVVFAFLADPATAPVIDPAVISYEPEGGTMGPAVRNTIRLRLAGIPVRVVSETVGWEPPHRMAFRSVRPRWPVVVEGIHTFEPADDGTRYTWAMRFRPTGLFGRALSPLAAWSFRRNAAAQQSRLYAALAPPPA